MKLYRKGLLLFIFVLCFNGRSFVDSRPENQGTRHYGRRSASGGRSHSALPKKLKPPEKYSSRRGHALPASEWAPAECELASVDIENKRSDRSVSYRFCSKTNTHFFAANRGFLFDALSEGPVALWRCRSGKCADLITVTEGAGDKRSIKIFIPSETADDSLSDSDSHSEAEHTYLEFVEKPYRRSSRRFGRAYELADAVPGNFGRSADALMLSRGRRDRHHRPRQLEYYETDDEQAGNYGGGSNIVGGGSNIVGGGSNIVGKGSNIVGKGSNNYVTGSNNYGMGSNNTNIRSASADAAAGAGLTSTLPVIGGTASQTTNRLISVDVSQLRSTDEISHRWDATQKADVLAPRPGYTIQRVTKGSHLVWQHDYGPHPVCVLVMKDASGKSRARLRFADDNGRGPAAAASHDQHTTSHHDSYYASYVNRPDYGYAKHANHYRKHNKHHSGRTHRDTEAAETDPDSLAGTELADYKVPIDLTIDFRWNSFLFDYSKLNNVGIYTPKPGYGFRKIKLFKGYYPPASDYILWQTSRPDEYANRVQVFGDSEISLVLDNGVEKLFRKSQNQWVEDDGAARLYGHALTSADRLGLPQLSSSRRHHPKWTPALSFSPVELDISIRQSTDSCKLTRHDEDELIEFVFQPRGASRFTSVSEGSTVIWRSNGSRQCAHKVSLLLFSRNHSRQLFIHLVDGSYLVYLALPPAPFKLIKSLDND